MIITVKTKIKILAAMTIVFLLTFELGIFLGKKIEVGVFNPSGVQDLFGEKRINILIMGIDARSMEQNSRSDTMVLASIDKKTKKAVMVWIPRDTRVEVSPGLYGKINGINLLKGPEAACEAAGELLDCDVSYYVVVNFAGFADIVDALGGVHINIEGDMQHYDPDPDLNINLKPGPQLLDGQDALRYVRYRGGPTADIGRTARQQTFIKALADEMMQSKTILKLPDLVPELSRNIKTNIPLKDMLYMSKLAKDFELDNLITQTLPGYPYTEPSCGASYWLADDVIAKTLVDDLFAGKTYKVAQDPPDWIKTRPAAQAQINKEESANPTEEVSSEETNTGPGEENPDNPDNISPEEQLPADLPGEDAIETDPDSQQPLDTGGEGYETVPGVNNTGQLP